MSFELDITHLVEDSDSMIDYSASHRELGENAGRITWQNAVESATDSPLVTDPDQLQECRDYFAEFGAWAEEDLAAMSDEEINALLLQFIAGAIRERQHYVDSDEMDDYEERLGGRIYQGDDGRHYYHVGI